MQFVFKNLVFPFKFNEMRLNCHTKPPRLIETSDSIRTTNCTRVRESVDGDRKWRPHFSADICNASWLWNPRQLARRPGKDDIRSSRFRTPSISHRVSQLTYIMTDEDERELANELARLQQERRDLDAAIDALHQSPAPDLLRLQRLKKRKLQLRDRIAFIEDQITPDIIA